MASYSYLALGDSYTIGESVLLHKSFPYQAVQLLRKKGYEFQAPEIIAKTGWTTDELAAALNDYRFLTKYDFVSLLIGVNNQYRGKEIIEYKEHFEEVLKKAIALANGKKEHVFVVSIPDYGITPYAVEKDPEKIAREIDTFNNVNRALAIQYKVAYIDITTEFKKAATDSSLLAEDGLHPSAIEYEKWAEKLVTAIISQLK
jgi:lysophospholipase L1-like esterase